MTAPTPDPLAPLAALELTARHKAMASLIAELSPELGGIVIFVPFSTEASILAPAFRGVSLMCGKPNAVQLLAAGVDLLCQAGAQADRCAALAADPQRADAATAAKMRSLMDEMAAAVRPAMVVRSQFVRRTS
ncbi:MAG: hypothetical protein AB7O32_00080 [Vicinamibacterales bacterium]